MFSYGSLTLIIIMNISINIKVEITCPLGGSKYLCDPNLLACIQYVMFYVISDRKLMSVSPL